MSRHQSPVALQVNLSPEGREMLVELRDTGLFGEPGEGIESVADQLIREKLRELELQGWCGRTVARRRT